MQYHLRPVIPDDVDNGLLETLDSLSAGNSGWDSARAKQVIANMQDTGIHTIVAVTNGTVIGAGSIFIEPKLIHKGGKVGHIEDIATRKGCERAGIGSAIVHNLLEIAKNNGCYKVILSCSRDNIPFYRKLGFHEHETTMRRGI